MTLFCQQNMANDREGRREGCSLLLLFLLGRRGVWKTSLNLPPGIFFLALVLSVAGKVSEDQTSP